MSVVTEEMHSAVLGAYMNRLMTEMRADSDGELDIPSRDEVEFILAAVAPLIAKAERERCAKMAEAHQAEVQRNIDDNIAEVRLVQMVPSDNWPLIKARDWLKHTAAAIRALD